MVHAVLCNYSGRRSKFLKIYLAVIIFFVYLCIGKISIRLLSR